ncbi:MAG: lytic transglycosylase domain-containing protein [Parcubacteria group bacterium]
MASWLRKTLFIGGAVVLAYSVADAQTTGYYPYYNSAPAVTPSPARPTGVTYSATLSASDQSALSQALTSARSGDADTALAARSMISNPVARKLATWAIAEYAPEQLSFTEIDTARKELAGWPRQDKRQAAAEKMLEMSGMDASRIVLWFGDTEPQTAQGAMALASAYRAVGRTADATALVKRFWREEPFDADVQQRFLARFGDILTVDDHIKRADMLLYGDQGPATYAIVGLLPEPYASMARVRMAFRSGSSNANDLFNTLPVAQQTNPGVAFERAAYWREQGLDSLALGLVPYFGPPPTHDAAVRVWKERRALIGAALRAGQYDAAYKAAANTGMTTGSELAEAEFYAGWIALTRLKNPSLAAKHFAMIEGSSQSPITQGRALYWEGRAAEAAGDLVGAQSYYGQGAKHLTTFYGQLAAEKAGLKQISLGRDPVITQADRDAFEGRDIVQAAKMLASIGARDTMRVFVLHIDDVLPTAAQQAQLFDFAKLNDGQDLAMRVARAGAQRGLILPERGYPMMTPPYTPGGAEPAFVLSISRQESNFNPNIRSGAGAVGMMQLLPSTAQIVARKIGEPYSSDMLTDASYNMRLGSAYLGQLIDRFDGSYLMAAAGYNAGPGRPTQWASYCGDPRGSMTDPLDFIECIPFSETRNYVMRTLETTQVYRARLNGGTAPLTLSKDLSRGGSGDYASRGAPPRGELSAKPTEGAQAR